DIEVAPGELLREVQIRRDGRLDLPGVERVALNQRPVRRVVDVRIERRPRIESLRVVPADPRIDRGEVELRHAGVRELPIDEAVDPVVLRLPVKLHIATGEPVPRDQDVHVVIEREVVAEIREVAGIVTRGTHQVVQSEPREENAAAPTPSNVLKNEWQ